jgi:signal transduction histidine kinase
MLLAELVDGDELAELTAGFAELHGTGVLIADCEGDLVRAAGLPAALAAGEVEALRQRDEPGWVAGASVGLGYWVEPLHHEAVRIGVVAVGPCGATGEPEQELLRASRLAAQIARLLGTVVHATHARHVAAQLHVSTMEQVVAEIEDKNQRLSAVAERLQGLDRLKNNFLATVSHELRTPLTSVIGYSEMLLEGLAGPLNDEQRDYVGTILSKADQLLELITGILDVSLLESGSLRISRQPLALPELVEGAVRSVESRARKHGVTLALDGTPVPQVLGDGRKLQQVLRQLLGNAIKFTPAGGMVTVSWRVGPLWPDDELGGRAATGTELGVRLSVRDTGIGISPEKQAHIFEPFFQVDSSSTREYGGTGLGLTLVKSYVEAHGGHVWVESTLGVGSTFTVSLPTATGAPGG